MSFIEIKRKVGRPRKLYEVAAKRTRQKRHKESRDICTDELCALAKKKLRLDGNSSGSALIDTVFHHENANDLLNIAKKPESTKMSPGEALTLIIEANLTKSAYNVTRATVLKHNHDLYPSYKEVYNTLLHVCVTSLNNCVSHFQFNNIQIYTLIIQ